MKKLISALLIAIAFLSSGCVTKSVHEATLQELNATRASLDDAQRTIDGQKLEIKRNQDEIAFTRSELKQLDVKKLALQQELFNAQNTFQESQMSLKDLQQQLQESQAKLDTMRDIEAETKKRNEIYARFVQKLQKMIDGGQLTLSIEKGRIVINLPENVLFPSGSAAVNTEGKKALTQIAGALKEFNDRRFQIEVHTDNVPIKSSSYPSNWELSTARALSVLHLMIDEGVQPQNVSAAGFGEFQPRADNATKEGKALNRRIEIIMQPNLDILSSELPKVTQ